MCLCVHPHHINQLGDFEPKAYFNSVVGTLDWSDPALVALEKVLQEGVLHLCQGHKLTWTWDKKVERGLTTIHCYSALFYCNYVCLPPVTPYCCHFRVVKIKK